MCIRFFKESLPTRPPEILESLEIGLAHYKTSRARSERLTNQVRSPDNRLSPKKTVRFSGSRGRSCG
jgi:hypothetical protein